MVYDPIALDGKRINLLPTDCCVSLIFAPFSCCNLCPWTGEVSFEGNDKMFFKNIRFCGCLRPSPVPCCMGCGCGPCAQEPLHTRQPDGTWKGSGSPFPGDPGCCAGICSQDLNMITFPKENIIGRDNAAVYQFNQEGMNCSIPPCVNGPCSCLCCGHTDQHAIMWLSVEKGGAVSP